MFHKLLFIVNTTVKTIKMENNDFFSIKLIYYIFNIYINILYIYFILYWPKRNAPIRINYKSYML